MVAREMVWPHAFMGVLVHVLINIDNGRADQRVPVNVRRKDSAFRLNQQCENNVVSKERQELKQRQCHKRRT